MFVRIHVTLLAIFFLVSPRKFVSGNSCACTGCTGTVPDCSSADGAQIACNTCCYNAGCITGSWNGDTHFEETLDAYGGGGGNSCFHKDSLITYKGENYSLEDFLANKHPECKVPHTPNSKGVVITTSCDKIVRVTDTHLMASKNGYQLAYSLKPGDVLFGNMEHTEECVVEKVEKERGMEQYFGLNCLSAEVLVNGIKASTFGDFHTLPSWYMYYMGNLIGVEKASKLGDFIAEWYLEKK